MNYLLSIDGGGTKTEFCLADTSGNVIGSIKVGSSNYKSVGEQEVLENIKEGFHRISIEYAVELKDILFSVLGISGIDSDSDYERIKSLLVSLGLDKKRFYLCNDGVLAYYASAREPGIVVISGTGSIVLGISKEKKIKRAGGWGYYYSDEGSGYWIGAKALSYALLYSDGCHEYAPLFEAVKEHFKLESLEELPYAITEVTDIDKIADIAKLVVSEAEKQETLSLGILKEGALRLAEITCALWKKLHFEKEESVTIVFSGGVLRKPIYNKLLEESITRLINPDDNRNFNFVLNDHMPVKGGIELAKQFINN